MLVGMGSHRQDLLPRWEHFSYLASVVDGIALTEASKQYNLQCLSLLFLLVGKQNLLVSSYLIESLEIQERREAGQAWVRPHQRYLLHHSRHRKMMDRLCLFQWFHIVQICSGDSPLLKASCLALTYSIPILFQSRRSLRRSVRFL